MSVFSNLKLQAAAITCHANRSGCTSFTHTCMLVCISAAGLKPSIAGDTFVFNASSVKNPPPKG